MLNLTLIMFFINLLCMRIFSFLFSLKILFTPEEEKWLNFSFIANMFIVGPLRYSIPQFEKVSTIWFWQNVTQWWYKRLLLVKTLCKPKMSWWQKTISKTLGFYINPISFTAFEQSSTSFFGGKNVFSMVPRESQREHHFRSP